MTALLHINWSYCPGCAEGDHTTHVAEYFDDDQPKPCACSRGGGSAPACQSPPPEPVRDDWPEYDDWSEEPWTEPDPPDGVS